MNRIPYAGKKSPNGINNGIISKIALSAIKEQFMYSIFVLLVKKKSLGVITFSSGIKIRKIPFNIVSTLFFDIL